MATDTRRRLASLGLVALLLLWLWFRPGCRSFPPPSSPEALKLVQQLYTACNTRSPERLAQVEQQLDELLREGKISREEHRAASRIIDQANAGNWDAAAQRSLRFAQDQVR